MDKAQIKTIIKKNAQWLMPIALLAASVLGYNTLLALRTEVKSEVPQERVWNVYAQKAVAGDIQPTLRVFGEVVAGRKIALRALVSGEIMAMHPNFREGGVIDKDEDLFQIDPFNYKNAVDEALARLTESEARLEELIAQRQQEIDSLTRADEQAALSLRDLERSKKLMGKGFISEKTMDDKKLAYSNQLQNVESRRNNLAIQSARITQQEGAVVRSQIVVSHAERELSRTLLHAPFRGFLSGVSAAVGRVVNVNDPIAEMIDADQLEVRFHLSDAQFGRIIASAGVLIGEAVKIAWRVGDETFTFDGSVIRIGAQISQAAGGVSIFSKITIEDFNSNLRPGAFVQVHLPDRAYTQVVRLPADSLFNNNIVYAVIDERLVPRTVKVLDQIGDDIIVKGGVQDGDLIMTTWFAEAGPGTKVLAIEKTQAAQ